MSDVGTVIGVFEQEDAARKAVHELSGAGFPPGDVGIVSGDVREARDVLGTRRVPGAIIGAALGFVVGMTYLLIPAFEPYRESSWVAFAHAIFTFPIAGALIGAISGQIFPRRDPSRYENAIDRGAALVRVRAPAAEHERARQLMRDLGARDVRVEPTGERPS